MGLVANAVAGEEDVTSRKTESARPKGLASTTKAVKPTMLNIIELARRVPLPEPLASALTLPAAILASLAVAATVRPR